MQQRDLWSTPGSRGDVILRAGEASLRLGWDLTTAGEPMVGLAFTRVRAYRFRADGECTAWHIAAYEKLVEVLDSPWIEELMAVRVGTYGPLPWPVRHFMAYFDDAGCFEIAAADWSVLPPQPGLDGRPLAHDA